MNFFFIKYFVLQLLFLNQLCIIMSEYPDVLFRWKCKGDDCRTYTTAVVLIHGWTQSWDISWYDSLTNAFLSRNDCCIAVMQVDYSSVAKLPYPQAVRDSKLVGDKVADYLMNITELRMANVHLVGHSLGGQISGFVGEKIINIHNLRRNTSEVEKLGLITALDPAGPMFYGSLLTNGDRLDASDASFVIAIHTDAGKFGYSKDCGHQDIYPHGGGVLQPGCPPLGDMFCSHHKSIEYYTNAVKTGNLTATQCTDYGSFVLGFCKQNRKINVGAVCDTYPTTEGTLAEGRFFF